VGFHYKELEAARKEDNRLGEVEAVGMYLRSTVCATINMDGCRTEEPYTEKNRAIGDMEDSLVVLQLVFLGNLALL
jgi:hypothetical protein